MKIFFNFFYIYINIPNLIQVQFYLRHLYEGRSKSKDPYASSTLPQPM